MTINNTVDEFKIKNMKKRGSNDIVIAQALIGESYKRCPSCLTYNMLEINKKYVCIECEPTYQKLYGYD